MTQKWTKVLDGCLERRIPPEKFGQVATDLHSQSPIPGRKIAEILLRPRIADSENIDPRIYTYFERLLALKIVDASEVLQVTFEHSRHSSKSANPESTKNAKWHNPPVLEEVVLQRLSKGFQTEVRPVNNVEGLRTLGVVTLWMHAMATSHTNDAISQVMTGIHQQPQQQSVNVRDALGMLMVGIIENQKMLKILNHTKGKGTYAAHDITNHPTRPDSPWAPSESLTVARSPQTLFNGVIFFHSVPVSCLHWVSKCHTNS